MKRVGVVLFLIIVSLGLVSGIDVCTPADLNNVRDNLNGNYVQTCNIDLTGFAFNPIGSLASPFTGVYDGNGYEISGHFISSSPGSEAGLFGVIDGSSVLRNMTLRNVRISSGFSVGGLVGTMINGTVLNSNVDGIVESISFGGGLVGWMQNGSVIDSRFSGMIGGSTTGSRNGGLIGYMGGDSKIVNSSTSVEVKRGGVHLGGFVGQMYGNSFIKDSHVFGSVTKNSSGSGGSVGGFVGAMVENSSIENSYTNCDVFGPSNLGGFVGSIAGNSSIRNSYSSGDFVNGTISAGVYGGFIGGLQDSAYVNDSFSNITNVIANGSLVGGFAGQSISIGSSKGVVIENSYSRSNVKGGINVSILGRSTNSIGGFIGLIGGKIRINNSYSTGDVEGGIYRVGGFIGESLGQQDLNPKLNASIENSYSKGNVRGINQVGGFVGSSEGTGLSIINSHSYGNVSGNSSVGGFIGWSEIHGDVSPKHIRLFVSGSSSHGNVYGDFSTGGFIGSMGGASNGTIINSYSQSNVTAYVKDGGGFVGIVTIADPVIARIFNSYSAGKFVNLTGNHMGGFAGSKGLQVRGESVYYSYWDKDKSTTLLSCGNDDPLTCGNNIFPRTTEEMKKSETYVNWDFVNVWDIIETQTYPFFGKCSNGVVDNGEQCDDGGKLGGDECSAQCRFECNTEADVDMDGIITSTELYNYIQKYYTGNVDIVKLSDAIMKHLNGCGPSG